MLPRIDSLQISNAYSLKVSRAKEVFHTNENQKKARNQPQETNKKRHKHTETKQPIYH